MNNSFNLLSNCCRPVCVARHICDRASQQNCRCCNGIPLVRSTAITFYTTQNTTLAIPYLALPSDRFVLEVDQTIEPNNLQPMDLLEAPQSSGGDETTLPLFDRFGNYIRTDALLRTINARKARIRPCFQGSAYRFRAVLGTDPIRVNILDCILPSTHVEAPVVPPEAASAASALVFEPTDTRNRKASTKE